MNPRRILLGLVALAGTCVVACGGRQSAPVEVVDEEPCETAPCISERWDQPPPQIGQTPPDEPAPEGALEDFEPAGD